MISLALNSNSPVSITCQSLFIDQHRSAMPPIWTVGQSEYNNLLRASIPGGAFFQTALYPPVIQNQFDVGTVFSYMGNGIVNTLGFIVCSCF